MLQEDPSGDLDSDRRVFLIAARVGNDTSQAEAFLRSALAFRRESLVELQGKIGQEGSGAWLADQYVSLRARAATAMRKAELKVIDSILDGLRDGTHGPKRPPAR